MIRRLRLGRAGWTFASTALTGVTNVAVSLAIQGTGGSAWLGAWAIAAAPLTIALAMQRALLSQTALRGAGLRVIRGSVGMLAMLWSASVVLSVVLTLGFGLPSVMLLIGIAIPAVLLQDAYRMRQFGQQRPAYSTSSDALWLATSVLAAVAVIVVGAPLSPTIVVVAYVVGAVVAAGFSVWTWPRTGRDLAAYPRSGYMLLESGSVIGLSNVAQIVVASAVSLEVVGELRLATTLVQPVIFIGNFALSFLVPRLQVGEARGMVRSALIAGSLCLGAGACCLAIVTVFGPVMEQWLAIDDRTVLLFAGVVLVVGLSLGSALTIGMVGVRSTAPTHVWLSARLAGSIADPAVSIPAGIAFGATGLALGPLANNVVLLTALVLARTILPTSTVDSRTADVHAK